MKRTHKFFRTFCIFSCCLFILAACGRNEEEMQPSPSGTEDQSSVPDGENMDVAVEEEAFYDVASELNRGRFLGMQFWQGEPVQLWMSEAVGEGEASVYMYRKDGTREVCIERIDEDTARMIYIRDSEGSCYIVSGEVGNKKIARLDSVGKVQYTVPLGGSLWDICALEDGRLALLTSKGNSTAGGYNLLLLDSDGKLATVFEAEKMDRMPVLGVSGHGLLLLLGDYVYQVNLMDGKKEQIYSFRQTAYDVQEPVGFSDIQDFRMGADGGFMILRTEQRGSGHCETIKLVAQDRNKKEVVLRTTGIINQETWLKERILEFNNAQEEYRVVIDAYEDGDDLDAFIAATGVELATGKGAEILMGSILTESVSGLIEKGILMDLAPLMEQSGIREEDYFPITFDMWRTGDSIYCLLYDVDVEEQLMSTAVLGDVRKPSIEQLTDAMLAYPDQMVYYDTVYYGEDSASTILTELLQGSENLWGMVDWEKGTCDFTGELFRKLLEVSKRYQFVKRNNYPSITDQKYLTGVSAIYYNFRTRAEEEIDGYAPIGILFDDGSHPVPTIAQSKRRSLMLNANAANRDGAWEFVKFLLSEEAQETLGKTALSHMTVKKSVFEALMEKEIASGLPKNLSKQRVVFEGPLTRERADEIKTFLESARALPYKTEPVLAIIQEESREYFNGNKSIEQVADVIENRVQTFLDEQRKK